MKPRLETMPERIERIMYEYGEAGAKKPAHYDNKNIITYENKGVPPKKFDAMDKSTYPSDKDQYQRLIQKDPQMKNTMTSNEIVLAEFTPKDIKAMDPKDRKLVRSAKAKKFRLLNEKKISEGPPKNKKIFESILDNLKKDKSMFRAPFANGGSTGMIDDPLYKVYIQEIELGNLDKDIPFDKWRDQYEEIQLEGPLSKKKERTVIDDIILETALAKIENSMQGLSVLIARRKLESGGKVVDFLSYAKSKKPKIKQLNLADYFKAGMAISQLTDQERDLVNDLLRRTLGKDPK